MSGGERFRGTGAGAVSRILREHRACDAGFDVSRHEGPPGGRLRIRCKGCGQEMVYRASDAGSWGALQGADLAAAAENGADERRRIGPGGPGWRAISLLAALVAAAVLAAVLLAGQGGDETSGSSPVGSGEEAPGATPGPPATPAPKQPDGAPARAKRPVALDPRIVPSAGFSIGLAPGWDQGLDGAAIAFARNKEAEVRVFYERPALSYRTMLEALGDLLRNEHPETRLTGPALFRFGDVSGRELTAKYAGGSEVGVATAAGGRSYFVLVRIDRGAGRSSAREARAIHASFRPL